MRGIGRKGPSTHYVRRRHHEYPAMWQIRSRGVLGASEFTGQSIGLPPALPGSGEGARGPSPFPSSSPGTGRAIGNPFDCPVNSEAPGTNFLETAVG